ncbi:MAG: hypothetical protein NVSMB32_00760 [Actinomycetota bacterium]
MAIDQAAWQQLWLPFCELERAVAAPRLARAILGAVRAGALATGSIGGMYPVDVDLVVDVAMAANGWMDRLSRKDPQGVQRVAAIEAGQAVVSHAVAAGSALSESWICRLRQTLCAGDADPPPGYRVTDCQVRLPDGSLHPYPPAASVPQQMSRLVSELASGPFREAHPLLQAAYAHHGLVAIHPFRDGNGRVGRALASVPLQRDLGIPLVILPRSRQGLLDRLQGANLGRRESLVDFFAARARDAAAATAAGLAPTREETRNRLHTLVGYPGR